MARYFGDLTFVRLLFSRGLAAIYFVAFLSTFNQFPALLGENGLLPVRDFLRAVRFRDAPSLFHWRYSDALLKAVTSIGMLLSALVIIGIIDLAPIWVWVAVWLVIWALYLSIVNVGQTFYSFGWESMILEAGFFAAFLGPRWVQTSWIPIAILRWMLFRTEFGAGLIKVRHDECWRNLTCLYYHYETQPLPNALSWYFHRFPKWLHRHSVMFSHFVQLVAPFGLFAPQPVASIAGAFLIVHQLLLVMSGNYSWLNWLTIVLGVTALDCGGLPPPSMGRPLWFEITLYALGALTIALSIQPALNFFSKNQAMNYCWNRFHLVCAYGAFGSVTKERYEIVLEASADGSEWTEYVFRAKPGNVKRTPPQVAPYHLRLDWLMWFLPFSVMVSGDQIYMRGYDVWFVRLVKKLLEGDAKTRALLRDAPQQPKFIRAGYYLYQYTTATERKESRAWWKRRRIGEYLPAVTLDDLNRALR